MITFEDFSFKYEAQAEPTLKHIHLTIQKGEKVLIAGPSGSGKSTLGQLLNGIIPDIHKGESSGVFTINGRDAFELSVYEKSHLVSTVLQDTDGQFIGLSVAEDLAFSLENDALPQSEIHEQVAYWAERLALTDFLNHRPQDLSGGQKQRVSLAGVLIDESPILLFDEPLANLDPKTGQTTIELIDRIHREEQATTIIIEHRLEDVFHRPLDRIVLMSEGQIIFNGKPDDLLATDLLETTGIREPLYLTSLKSFGFDLSGKRFLSDVNQLELEALEINLAADMPMTASKDKPPILEVRDLSVAYGEHQILKDLSFNLYQGERVALVGKNGAGKSTLAKTLCQFLQIKGQIFYQGQEISTDSIKERSSRIGYVLQNPNQMISQSLIFDEVALGLRLRGLDEEEIRRRVHAVLETCGLYPYRNWPISALSFGQKKRVTIASILVLEPDIILLDEPTAGQDMRHYTDIMTFLDQLNQAGHTIVMITHDMQLMLEYTDRVLVLSDGKLIADERPAKLLTSPELMEPANLKETSLFALAERCQVSPLALTADYITKKKGMLWQVNN